MQDFESCDQPKCFLRKEGVDRHALAQILVRVLAGETVAVKATIEPHARCVDCVERVWRCGHPLPTIEDVERSIRAGRWTHRRSRRLSRRNAHTR
jgi:hypothetical protein